MATPQHLIKVVWGGRFFSNEIWACGVHMAFGASGLLPPASLLGAISAMHQSGNSGISPEARLEFIKANEISLVTGKYLDAGAAHTHVLVPPLAGPTGTVAPPQMAQCVSLGTALTRGRGSKGRFYLPASHQTIDADGRQTVIVAQAIADTARDMIQALNAVGDHSVVVWSQIGQTANVVTTVRVGRVMDTQRRRRSAMPEDYQLANII